MKKLIIIIIAITSILTALSAQVEVVQDLQLTTVARYNDSTQVASNIIHYLDFTTSKDGKSFDCLVADETVVTIFAFSTTKKIHSIQAATDAGSIDIFGKNLFGKIVRIAHIHNIEAVFDNDAMGNCLLYEFKGSSEITIIHLD